MSQANIAVLRQGALDAEKAGRPEEAAALFDRALEESPKDAALWNSAAGSALRMSDGERAVTMFRMALTLDPRSLECAINLGIALRKVGRPREAIEELAKYEDEAVNDARYWSVRGAAERDVGKLAAAARSYDHCLALKADHKQALQGRARVALERGEANARERFERALQAQKGDAQAWLGFAQALDVSGQPQEALKIATQLAEQAPQWTDGLDFLAQMRIATGQGGDFASGYAAAVKRVPQDKAVRFAWARSLAGVDRYADAADVAARAARDFADEPGFRLLEAIHAGEAGDDERAERIFAALDLQSEDRLLHEARHRLRRHEADRAEELLARALADDPFSVAGWALRSIAWRMLGDPRNEWLNGQEGLVQLLPLPLDEDTFEAARKSLHGLHDRSALPIGQSVRGGTQTRGRIFSRTEPEFLALGRAVAEALETYRSGLPPLDETHPLLRLRDAPLHFAGSWSVRLVSNGHHTGHVHPRGVLSSALYMELPEGLGAGDRDGWLELGRPPADLRLDMPPMRIVEPKRAHLALFPSSLYHGTRPFEGGCRMTVAFDVVSD
ncbi:hypothetical protein GCM10011371_23470 [Novosphingobium marinum]|uniref:Putative Zn-dependent protease n=1 Tax=Novosphingobium marinum TaxID=1514948 RepID=A0A7Y9XXM3_9SPHN|nr:tetratricopeptide repeat protein [Novosphingobium marinum]NYH96462.1 putative Zn-dependent protease [Novosphingobium marinum]GGC35419.1 hypothetical protein GCM10011371_23470 [Novosphingobium marinum]